MPGLFRYSVMVGFLAGLVSGCASTGTMTPVAEQAAPEPEEPQPIPVVRHGRYTLVEVEPERVQPCVCRVAVP